MRVPFVMAKVTFRPPSYGGRISMPEGDGYAPYFRSESMSEELAVRVYEVPSSAKFGVPYTVRLELTYYPRLSYGKLSIGERFFLTEGPKTVAEGLIESDVTYS